MINSTDTFIFRRVHPVSQRVSNGRATVQELVDLVGSSIEIPIPESSLPIGGSTGQALIKNSSTDFDVSWGTVSGGSSIADGDKGDITVSGSGATWTIDAAAVTYSKLQDVAANSVLARSSATLGDVGEVSLSTSQLFGRGETGNLTPISLGTNLSMSGTTLNAANGAPATYFNPYIF
jgi:hypothetical protein